MPDQASIISTAFAARRASGGAVRGRGGGDIVVERRRENIAELNEKEQVTLMKQLPDVYDFRTLSKMLIVSPRRDTERRM